MKKNKELSRELANHLAHTTFKFLTSYEFSDKLDYHDLTRITLSAHMNAFSCEMHMIMQNDPSNLKVLDKFIDSIMKGIGSSEFISKVSVIKKPKQ